MKVDIAIDTSALSNVLDSESLRTLMLTRLHTGDRLFVCLNVLEELLAQQNIAKLKPRALALGSFVAAARGSVNFSPCGRTLVLDREWRVRFHQGGFHTPCLAKPNVTALVKYLTDPSFEQQHSPFVDQLRNNLNKEFALDIDARARKGFPGNFATPPVPNDLGRYIKHFRSNLLGRDSHFLVLATRSPRHRKRVRREPERYRAAIMHASYMLLNALGSSFADIGYPANPDILRAPRSGEWIDGLISTAAAHLDVLVSDDGVQRAKTSFVAQEFGWPLAAKSLGEYLAAA